ncbi:MAG: putative membrane protein [uncultured bacterium]|nr:MAG: putative membrane protein [uncultured bacterium]
MIDYLSIYLAKLIGLSFIFIGAALFFKPHDFQNTIKGIAKSNAIMTLVTIIPLVVGIALITSHNVWVANWSVIITIIGWLIFINGIARLFFHKKIMKYCVKAANNKKYFIAWGIILFIIGLYLAGKGFFIF